MPEQTEPDQITLMKRLVELSQERSQMSSERTFMNAERTLSVWIRTALGLMIFGGPARRSDRDIAAEHFANLFMNNMPAMADHYEGRIEGEAWFGIKRQRIRGCVESPSFSREPRPSTARCRERTHRAPRDERERCPLHRQPQH
jgi:hypothetical protein